MKTFLKIFFLFCIISSLNAQPSVTWQKTYGSPGSDDNAYFVTQTFDGGYIMTGHSRNGTLVIKTNPYGDTIWTRVFNGDAHNAIIQTSDSNYVMVGQITNDTIFYPKGYILKINRQGSIIWSKIYGGPFSNSFLHLIELSDKKLMIVGTKEFQFPPPLLYSIYLLKTNQNGEEVWRRTYDSTGFGSHIQEVQGRGYLISGSTSIYTDYDGIIKYKHSSLGTGLVINNNKEFIFMKNESNGLATIRITKTDTLFNIKWTQVIQKSNIDLYGYSFIKTKDDFVIGGEHIDFDGDINGYLVKIDSLGKIVWESNLFPRPQYDETINCVANCTDSGYIAVGINSAFTGGNQDYYAVKTDKNGNTVPVTIIKINSIIPVDYQLYQNYPNPFNSSTNIRFSLKKNAHITLTVYSILGQQVDELINESKVVGEYLINYDANNLSSGIYFYTMTIQEENSYVSKFLTKKLTILK